MEELKSYKLTLTKRDRKLREENLLKISPVYKALRENNSINKIRLTLKAQWYQVYDTFVAPENLSLKKIVALSKLIPEYSISEVLMLCSASFEDVRWYELSKEENDIIDKRFTRK